MSTEVYQLTGMKVQDVWRQKDCSNVNYMIVQSTVHLSTFLEDPGSAVNRVLLVILVLGLDLELKTYFLIGRHLNEHIV
jgi:hypothetical protein